MSEIIVSSQAELDAALLSDVDAIRIKGGFYEIHADHGKTITVGDARIQAFGTTRVQLFDGATGYFHDNSVAYAYERARVILYDTAYAKARDHALVRATHHASFDAYDNAVVTADDWSMGMATDSAHVSAYHNSIVRAYLDSWVKASSSATVRGYGRVRVIARDTSTIEAYDDTVTVHTIGHHGTITGGTVFPYASARGRAPEDWCRRSAVEIRGDHAILYKALRQDLTSGEYYNRPTVWRVGTTVTCDDWSSTSLCGGGLHLSPTPREAAGYADDPRECRYLQVEVPVSSLVPLGTDKCKVPSCRVLAEVDSVGRRL